MDKRAIGVFDSGVGGLTAVREMMRILPHENIIYFGDTARVPYGSHDKETIIKFSKQDLQFLLEKDVKAVLVACGTVSSTALSTLQRMTNIPVVGVVESAAKEAVEVSRNNKILVLATTATIKSHAYLNEILKIDKTVDVYEMACPLFVPLVENGYIESGNEITRMVVADYLKKVSGFKADTVILGCTHYPLLKHFISDAMGNINMVEVGRAAVKYMLNVLHKEGLQNDDATCSQQEYFVSESIESFTSIANMFLGNEFHGRIEKINIDAIEVKKY